jgi:hypothetical protein
VSVGSKQTPQPDFPKRREEEEEAGGRVVEERDSLSFAEN